MAGGVARERAGVSGKVRGGRARGAGAKRGARRQEDKGTMVEAGEKGGGKFGAAKSHTI
jgi:hypothetical protein